MVAAHSLKPKQPFPVSFPHPTSAPGRFHSLLVPHWHQSGDKILKLQHGAAHRCLKSRKILISSWQFLLVGLPVYLCLLSTCHSHGDDTSKETAALEVGDPHRWVALSQMTAPAMRESQSWKSLQIKLMEDCRRRENSQAHTPDNGDSKRNVGAAGDCSLATDLGHQEVRL